MATLSLPSGPTPSSLLQKKDLRRGPCSKGTAHPPGGSYRRLARRTPKAETASTCRSISARLISILAINLCQKPTGTKLILNTL